MKRDLVVGVVRARHDVHKAAGEVRHTVGYHACNGNVVYCDASDKQHLFEGGDLPSNFRDTATFLTNLSFKVFSHLF